MNDKFISSVLINCLFAFYTYFTDILCNRSQFECINLSILYLVLLFYLRNYAQRVWMKTSRLFLPCRKNNFKLVIFKNLQKIWTYKYALFYCGIQYWWKQILHKRKCFTVPIKNFYENLSIPTWYGVIWIIHPRMLQEVGKSHFTIWF